MRKGVSRAARRGSLGDPGEESPHTSLCLGVERRAVRGDRRGPDGLLRTPGAQHQREPQTSAAPLP